jgi:pimeloyl-ACP methyl ester carboxylesterase
MRTEKIAVWSPRLLTVFIVRSRVIHRAFPCFRASVWGFSRDAFAAPVAIWQGDHDLMVPFAHGQWLSARIPGARAHLEPGAGHLTMTVTAIGRILDDLLDLAGRPRG